MRSHTIRCINNEKMERFPLEEEKRALPIVECRMPEGE